MRWGCAGVRLRVKTLQLIDQDKAARSSGEGAKETEREQEKLGLRGGRKAGPLRRGGSMYWRGCRGYGGRSALVLAVCIVIQWRLGRPDSGLSLGLNPGSEHRTQRCAQLPDRDST